jgi:hypothetical protein
MTAGRGITHSEAVDPATPWERPCENRKFSGGRGDDDGD